MSVFERFDILLVPFPFTDRNTHKRRPIVVLSAHESFNDASGHIVGAMITSASHPEWPLDVPITQPHAAGLPKSCMIRMKLFTLPQSLIIKPLGHLADKDIDQLQEALTDLLRI